MGRVVEIAGLTLQTIQHDGAPMLVVRDVWLSPAEVEALKLALEDWLENRA